MNRKGSKKSFRKRPVKSRKPRKSRKRVKDLNIVINKTTPKKGYKSRNLDYIVNDNDNCGSYEGRMIKSELYKINNLSRELYYLLEDHEIGRAHV